MESKENEMLYVSFHMATFLMIIESTLEVDNVYQVESDDCVLMAATLFWPNIRCNRVTA